jgi:hypothetical protein
MFMGNAGNYYGEGEYSFDSGVIKWLSGFFKQAQGSYPYDAEGKLDGSGNIIVGRGLRAYPKR